MPVQNLQLVLTAASHIQNFQPEASHYTYDKMEASYSQAGFACSLVPAIMDLSFSYPSSLVNNICLLSLL